MYNNMFRQTSLNVTYMLEVFLFFEKCDFAHKKTKSARKSTSNTRMDIMKTDP